MRLPLINAGTTQSRIATSRCHSQQAAGVLIVAQPLESSKFTWQRAIALQYHFPASLAAALLRPRPPIIHSLRGRIRRQRLPAVRRRDVGCGRQRVQPDAGVQALR